MGSPLSWDLAVTEVPSKSMTLPISRGEGPLRGITPRESAIKQLENFFYQNMSAILPLMHRKKVG